MSEEEHGCSTVSSQTRDIGPCNSMDRPVVADSSTTVDGSSVEDSCRPTTSNIGPAKGSSDTTANSGSATDNTGETASGNSATIGHGKIATVGLVTDSSGKTANGGSVTDSSDMTANGGSTTTNDGPENDGPDFVSSKTVIGCRTRYEKRDLEILEQEYLRNPNPTISKRREIAGLIQKKEDQVRSWFERRRRKQRKKNGVPVQFRQKPKEQESTSGWSQFADLSIQNEPSVNLSYYPTPEHEVRVKIRDQTFVPNFYREVNEGVDGISLQQQPPNGQRVVRELSCPQINTGPMTDEQDQAERQIDRDHPSFTINSGLSNMYYTVLGEDGKIFFRHRKFVSNFYSEVNGDVDVIPLQQQPHSSQQVEQDRSCSPFNTGQITNEQDRAQGQKDVGKDHPLATNYHTELISGGHEVQKQEQQNDDRQAERDRYSTPVNPGLSTTNSTVLREEGEITLRHPKFVPNFYREVNLWE